MVLSGASTSAKAHQSPSIWTSYNNSHILTNSSSQMCLIFKIKIHKLFLGKILKDKDHGAIIFEDYFCVPLKGLNVTS